MSHTKGPWTVSEQDGMLVGRSLIISSPHFVIAELFPGCLKANARLIAAAPALLEALEALVVLVTDSTERPDDSDLAPARAAIASARGSK